MKKLITKNGKMTLDRLAQMVQRGFDGVFETMTTKKELQALREEVDERFHGVDSRFNEIDALFQVMDDKINALHFEIKEIKSVLPPVFKAMSQFDTEVVTIRQRLSRLEKKVGLSK